jgi:RNA polymerase sigma-70 factor, ECF subfamily
MSMERIRATIQRAWSRLRPPAEPPAAGRRQTDPPRPGRPRDRGTPPSAAERDALGKPGFADEALPWLDAVYRFALRLTRSEPAAEDLAQETFLRAFRAWDRFEPGTNCRSWLFTICRNTYLHEYDRARTKREVVEADLSSAVAGGLATTLDQRALAAGSPDDFFDDLVDDRLVEAIDELPAEFHDVLVLSDLGDLTYQEIADVLDLPLGTVKSRLFRARNQVRQRLIERGMETAHARRG